MSVRAVARVRAALAAAATVLATVGAFSQAAAQQGCPRASGAEAATGWSAYRGQDIPGAKKHFEAALRRCPNDQNARTGMGYVLLRQGDTAGARVRFQAVVAAEPDDVDALVGLGLVAWRTGDLAEVRERFDRVKELAPDNPTARDYLARLPPARRQPPATHPTSDSADAAWRRGDHGRALALYEARLKAGPDDGVALHRVALMRAWKQDYAGSLRLLDRLMKLEPRNLEARVDHARVRAWSGDVSGALVELDSLLTAHPADPGALEARALFEAWAGHYDASLAGYNQLLAIAPDNGDARRQRAQVLSWASRYEASRAVYDSILVAHPGDVQARLGLARVMTISGHLQEAMGQYRRILSGDPGQVAALRGLGRALSWEGRLVDGERAYRRARAVAPKDVATLVGLAQNLRWQGRNAAALETLETAQEISPNDGDVRDQLRSLRAVLAPQTQPSVVVEHDSDGNRMVSEILVGRWHPEPRLGLRADYYRRGLDQRVLSRSAWGLTLTGSWALEPGWTVSGTVGGSRNDGPARRSFTSLGLGLSSPGRYPYGGSLTWTFHALDATALLAQHGVRLSQLDLTGRWTPAPGWRLDASLGRAVFHGSERNQRASVALSASRRLTHFVTLGVDGRAFGFQKRLYDGYFDPDFYGIAEITGRWSYEPGHWSFLLEAAPGVQQVRSSGSPTGAYRLSSRVGYRFAPDRELSLAAGYSSTGLQSFSTGSTGYRYTAVILAASWVF